MYVIVIQIVLILASWIITEKKRKDIIEEYFEIGVKKKK